MKNKKGDEWYPLWVDKWLFGSTRHEFSHAQRAIWMDLMTLSKKDGGFIRANEGVPYPVSQLAGMFKAPTKLVADTIAKAIEVGKLKQLLDGGLFVISTEIYTISERHKRRVNESLQKGGMSANPDMTSESADTLSRLEEIRTKREKKREEEEVKEEETSSLSSTSFPKETKSHKGNRSNRVLSAWQKLPLPPDLKAVSPTGELSVEHELSVLDLDPAEPVHEGDVLAAIENYRQALSLPDSQSHKHKLIPWLRTYMRRTYLPDVFNIENHRGSNFHKPTTKQQAIHEEVDRAFAKLKAEGRL